MTTIYVTHDQKEALSIADRLAILKDGQVMQVGTPKDVYQTPATQFVAEFIGETNFVPATPTNSGFETPFCTFQSENTLEAEKVVCSLRPEAITVIDTPAPCNNFSGTRVETIYLGEVAQHKIKVASDLVLRVTEVNPKHLGEVGDVLQMTVDPCDVIPLSI